MKPFSIFIRLFKLIARLVTFPFLMVTFILAVVVIPFIFLIDIFHYLLIGSFCLTKEYMFKHMDKVAFHWYYLFDAFIGF